MRLILLLLGFLAVSHIWLSTNDVSGNEYIIGPFDTLDIQVWNQQELNRTIELDQEAALTFPLIGKIFAKGLSISELEQLIEKKLADGFLDNPKVTVSVKEYKSQKVHIFGEVNKPGSYSIKGKTHILEVISEAGGFTKDAGQIIKIIHAEQGEDLSSENNKENVGVVGGQDLDPNKSPKVVTIDFDRFEADGDFSKLYVVAGDTIHVSQNQWIFVIGEVEKPGQFKWRKNLTVHQAISIAGGPTKLGKSKRAKRFRVTDGIENESNPEMSDLVIPNDIIKVPRRHF